MGAQTMRTFYTVLISFLKTVLVLLGIWLAEPSICFAQSAPTQNLDLSSTEKSMQAPADVPANTFINIAGNQQAVSPNQMLTAAEHVALSQVLTSGQQALTLNALGAAVAGSFNLTSAMSQNINNFVIPSGVSAVQDVSNIAHLALSGNFVNSGQYQLISSNSQITSALIQATNIQNNVGAVLATFNNISLTLSAVNNIVNAGTITSSSNLTLYAGGSITNMPQAVMQAMTNLNMQTNSVVNQGILSSITSNINIASLMANNLTLANAGELRALAGSINIGNELLTNTINTSITGGKFTSKELNIYSGFGTVSVSVDEILGLTNISANEAHITARGGTLEVGKMNLSGNPTIFNTNGNVSLHDDLVLHGQDLAIMASGDVLAAGITKIDTSSDNANGGKILIIAGANFQQTDTEQFIVHGPSESGGSINLNADSPVVTIATKSQSNDGGNVTLAAFAGSKIGSGTINLSEQSNLDVGTTAGLAGDVHIFADGAGDESIRLGSINTQSLSGSSGVICLQVADLNVSGPGLIINNGLIDNSSGSIQTDILKMGRITGVNFNAQGGILAIATLADIVVPENATWQSDSIYLTTSKLTNNGMIATSVAGGYIYVTSPSSLTLEGDGSFYLSGNNCGYVIFSSQGDNPIYLNSSWTYIGEQSNSFEFIADNVGGSIITGVNTRQTVDGSAYFGLVAPTIVFGSDTTIWSNGISIVEIASYNQSQHIFLPANSSVNVHTSGGYIALGTYSNAPLNFHVTAGGDNARAEFTGGDTYSWSNGSNTTIDSGVVFSADKNIIMNIDGGALINNGVITSSAYDGSILISAHDSDLTIAGNAQAAISMTGGGSPHILLMSSGDHKLSIQSSVAFDTGPDGNVTFLAKIIELGGNCTLSIEGGSTFATFSSEIFLGANSLVNGSNTITLYASGDPALRVVLPNDGTAYVQTTGGIVNAVGEGLSIESSGESTAELQVTGAPYLATAAYGDLTIGENVLIESDNDMQFYIAGGHSFINNGAIISSKYAGSIDIIGTTSLTLAGAPIVVAVTGGGAASIRVIGYDEGLTMASSYIFDAGSEGTVTLQAANGELAFTPGTTQRVFGGSELNLQYVSFSLPQDATFFTSNNHAPALVQMPGSNQAPQQLPTSNQTVQSNLIQTLNIATQLSPTYWLAKDPLNHMSARQSLGLSQQAIDIDETYSEIELRELEDESGDSPQQDSEMMPIALTEGSKVETARMQNTLKSYDTGLSDIKHLPEAKLTINKMNVVGVRQGETIVNGRNGHSFVKAHACLIDVGPHCIALIEKAGQIVKIRNLCENSPASLTVYSQGFKTRVSIGQELVIGPDDQIDENSLLSDRIARRSIKSSYMDTGFHAIRSEVSLMSLFERKELLRALLRSKDSHDVRIKERLIKTAACLMTVTKSHGKYVAACKNQ